MPAYAPLTAFARSNVTVGSASPVYGSYSGPATVFAIGASYVTDAGTTK